KPVPNMGNSTIAVDTDSQLAGVGRRVEGTLTAQVVSGNSFSLPAPASKQMYAGDGTWNVGGMVSTMRMDKNAVREQGLFGQIWGGWQDFKPAVFDYHPTGTPLLGTVTIQPPTQTFLRAYVRIR